MSLKLKPYLLSFMVALAYLMVGIFQSWSLAITILNDSLIVAIVALGINMQWGYAGLFNFGVAGFFALGGLAVVLISHPQDSLAWDAGTPQILTAIFVAVGTAVITSQVRRRMSGGRCREALTAAVLLTGVLMFRSILDPAVTAVEAVTPSSTGNVGGLGLPTPIAWIFGGGVAALVAWGVARTALGLRSDYLAIATLGIGQITIAVLMNEDWLDRGVKNVTNIGRWPVPDEIAVQQSQWFTALAQAVGVDPRAGSTVFVGLCFAILFTAILVVLLTLSELALRSPWGRMMRAIRDNEVAALAMGKDVKSRHLQVFVLGSAVIGIAGALYVSLHGLYSPIAYNDQLRYTFLVWAMVILGGSGNNLGSIVGALIIMLLWAEAESVGPGLFILLTSLLEDGPFKQHLVDSSVQMRLPIIGLALLLVIRFRPAGLLPARA